MITLIKKLVVKEFEVVDDDINDRNRRLTLGDMYTYFFDPETDKYYRPSVEFEVTGEDLGKLFVEVE